MIATNEAKLAVMNATGKPLPQSNTARQDQMVSLMDAMPDFMSEKENMTLTTASPDEAFERLLSKLKARVGSEIFSSWFGRLKLDEVSKSVVRSSVPTAIPALMDQQPLCRNADHAVAGRKPANPQS